jgi:nicotinamidase-related amidase
MAPTMTMRVPASGAEWFRQLQTWPLAEVAPDPAAAAVFSADMVVGFCTRGNLASPRLNALTHPVVDLFRQAYVHGIRHFVLVQDSYHPSTPEFNVFPPHCVRGTEEAHTIAELQALPFADLFTIMAKNSLHPALGTKFDHRLDAHPEVHTAVVVGNCTDLCVYHLAMHLCLPAEAVDTYDVPEDGPEELGATPHAGDFFHQVFLSHLALNGVEVVRAVS